MTSEKKQTIRRANHTSDPFYRAARATAQDKKISYDALGMLNYLLSKPDNWKVQPADLERTDCGRNKVYRVLKALIAAGYVQRIIHRDDKGRTIEVEYIVYELKQPLSENQEVDNQDVDNGHIKYKRGVHTKDIAANAAPPRKPRTKPLFDAVASHLFRIHGNVPKELAGRIGKAVAAIREMEPDGSEDELAAAVRDFHFWYMKRYQGIEAPKDAAKIQSHWLQWRDASNGGGTVAAERTAAIREQAEKDAITAARRKAHEERQAQFIASFDPARYGVE